MRFEGEHGAPVEHDGSCEQASSSECPRGPRAEKRRDGGVSSAWENLSPCAVSLKYAPVHLAKRVKCYNFSMLEKVVDIAITVHDEL